MKEILMIRINHLLVKKKKTTLKEREKNTKINFQYTKY